ncbi:Glutathione synthetase [Sarcoptes scabiei]|nr:Glutathione synthetase [Sarcoptes scabiei]
MSEKKKLKSDETLGQLLDRCCLTKEDLIDDLTNHICVRRYSKNGYDVKIEPLPITMFPSRFDRNGYELAKDLQPIINKLITSIVNDHQFLCETISTIPDRFIQNIFQIYEEIYRADEHRQYQLGIFRSDYMLDKHNRLKQIEINTIASAFVGLASKISEFHRYTRSIYGDEFSAENSGKEALEQVTDAILTARKYYHQYENTAILVLIQENESNIMDHKLIEWKLRLKSLPENLRIYRRTLKELDNGRIFLGPNRQLFLSISDESEEPKIEISVIYFRTGYAEKNYDFSNAWKIRLLLERSKAIKCPTIQLQLAGMKKFQIKLSELEIYERLLRKSSTKFNNLEQKLFQTFAKFYPINSETYKMIKKNPNDFVLKSNREGGSHNIFGTEIISKIEEIMEKNENDAYFLMDYIEQKPFNSIVIHPDKSGRTTIVEQQVESELGIYGSLLLDPEGKIVLSNTAGHLLRTKYHGTNESGIISSGGILDAIRLI